MMEYRRYITSLMGDLHNTKIGKNYMNLHHHKVDLNIKAHTSYNSDVFNDVTWERTIRRITERLVAGISLQRPMRDLILPTNKWDQW